jgi:hypothetical protein
MMRKKAAAKSKSAPRKDGRALLSGISAREPLALELYSIVRAALTKYGVSPAQQRRLFDQAQRATVVSRVSGLILSEFRALGDLITTWREEAPYVDSDGQPKVLTVEGGGTTFETLAKHFLPKKRLAEVVALACRTANVGTLPGGRIALYGDTMVNLSKAREGVFAQNILHIQRIFETCLFNAQGTQDKTGTARLERTVSHELSLGEFEKFQQAVRPQVHDLCEIVDRLLKSADERSTGKKEPRGKAGIGIYVYYDGSMRHVTRGRTDDEP